MPKFGLRFLRECLYVYFCLFSDTYDEYKFKFHRKIMRSGELWTPNKFNTQISLFFSYHLCFKATNDLQI